MLAARASAECASISASRIWMSAMRCGSVAVSASAMRAAALLVGLEHDLDQRLLGAGRFLRDLADAGVFRDGDRPALGAHIAGNDTEERRFAGAVLADEAGLGAGGQRHAGVVDEETAGNTGRKIGYRDHAPVLAELADEGKCRTGRRVCYERRGRDVSAFSSPGRRSAQAGGGCSARWQVPTAHWREAAPARRRRCKGRYRLIW